MAYRGTVTGVCSLAVTLKPIAVGASFAEVMVIPTVDVKESLQPSLTLNVNESDVAASLLEIYVTMFPVSVAVPCPGFDTSENTRVSPSGSEPVRAIVTAICSVAVTV